MSDGMTLTAIIIILIGLAFAITERSLPDHGGGVYMPGPSEGVLPYQ